MDDSIESSLYICGIVHIYCPYIWFSYGLSIRVLGCHLSVNFVKDRVYLLLLFIWFIMFLQSIKGSANAKAVCFISEHWPWPLWCWAFPWRNPSLVYSLEGVTWGSGKHIHWLRPPMGRDLRMEKTIPQKPATDHRCHNNHTKLHVNPWHFSMFTTCCQPKPSWQTGSGCKWTTDILQRR